MGRPQEATSSEDPRQQLVCRVADSSYFCKSPKLRAFLLYVCENAIAENPENVREQLIGARVFGRHSDYNANDDNIVRVEARELRKRLETYFATQGREEPLVIEIPRGSYLPVFRPGSPEGQAGELVALPEPAGSAQPRTVRPVWVAVLAGLLVVCLGALLWLGLDDRRLRREAAVMGSSAAKAREDYSFYGDLLGSLGATPNRETLLVLSNPRVIVPFGSFTREGDTDRSITVPNDLRPALSGALRPADRSMPFEVLHLTREDYTGMGEAISAFYVGRLMSLLRRPLRVTQSRFLNWEHVPKRDLIVLGGPASNDWTYQNGARTAFNFEPNGVENRNPGPGEAQHYVHHADPDNSGAYTEYSVIKMLTSPYGFRTLLLAGISSTGTGGVGEFFADASKMKGVYSRIRQASAGKAFPEQWEVLVEVSERDRVPVQATAVAVRPAAQAPPK